jgi:esterase/lipase
VVFGLAALAAAFLAGLEVSSAFDNDGGHVTWLTLFSGVSLVGSLLWWLTVSRPRRFSRRRGALAGMLIALLSYPAVLLLAEFLQRDWHANVEIGTLPERIEYALLLSGLALLTTGFAAMLLFSAIGAVIAWSFARIDPAASVAEPRRSSVLGQLSLALASLAAAVVACLSGVFLWLSLLPLNAEGFTPDVAGALDVTTYAEALAAYAEIEAREAAMPLHPRCSSTLLTHGRKVARAVIFFHGLTSCPAQADELADRLFAMGYNVYIPRLPGHGEADPLTLSLGEVTAEQFAGLAEDSVSLGRGLGDEVLVIGLSAGGTMASWLAQTSSGTDKAILVAPFFGPRVVPSWAVRAATNFLLLAPNMMIWWDASEAYVNPAMDYAYPRFATHGLAQVMRLGLVVDARAEAGGPSALAIGVVLNEADESVSNRLTERIVAAWASHGRDVTVEMLALSRRLPHDLIDPRQDGADTQFVNSMLIDMIERRQN